MKKGIHKFIEWMKNGKLEIRAYPSQNIHAKLYIMTFTEGDRDVGRVITGSSNFTQAGLIDNLEFNVELKTRAIMNLPSKNLMNYGKTRLMSAKNMSDDSGKDLAQSNIYTIPALSKISL